MDTWTRTLVTLVISTVATAALAGPPTPEEYLGFPPGADRMLMDYGQLTGFLKELAEASPRVELREIGRSALDRPMYLLLISTPENLSRLEELRAINRRLALDPAIPEEERRQLVRDGRVFLMAMLSMHSEEVAPAQALPLVAYELATSDDERVVEQLDRVVLMVVPTHNPDGMEMVVEHYRKQLGTPYEGSSLPGIYHRYVGHDNNRDYISLSQPESRIINRIYTTDWLPQVVVDKHQMGQSGPRYFVPEYHDPIAEVIDEGLWYWSDVFGSSLAKDLGGEGLSGVVSNWLFDEYWPGASSTSHWKGAITLLTEAASCAVASPVYVEATELTGRGKGLAEYKKSVNMPDPWPGGWWRLGDIVRYEVASMRSLLATAARHREEILRFRNDLCRNEVARGNDQPPRYVVLPGKQHDPGALRGVVELLVDHGLELRRLAAPVVVEGRALAAGDIVVPLAQPFRAFVKEVLEAQRYPVRRYTPGGEVIRPYDVTSWSLPLHHGLNSVQIDQPSAALAAALEPLPEGWPPSPAPGVLPDGTWGLAFPATANASFRAAFAALGAGLEVSRSRVAAAVAGVELPAGSFLVHGGRRQLEQLAATAEVAAASLIGPPDVARVEMRRPRIGLIETYFHDMDAGWTRYLFDSFGIPYRVVRPGEVAGLDLVDTLDVLVFPNVDKDLLAKGRYKVDDRYVASDLAPEFRRPISKEGLRKLAGFIEGGGIVVAWGQSAELFLDGLPLADEEDGERLELPARDVSARLRDQGLFVPSALLAARLAADHPLTWGMPATAGVLSEGRPLFATSIPELDTDRRVIATHPAGEVLLSGYVEREDLLRDRPVMVWLRWGRGQVVLYGFNPQFRASTPATYKLLLNALLLEPVEPRG